MSKPVDATSGQATLSPYYNINEYSGQLYKWSVERLNPDNLLCLPIGCIGVLASLVARVVEGALMLVVNCCLAVKGVVWGHTTTVIATPANANTNPATPPAAEEAGKGKKAKTKDQAEESTSSKKNDKSKKAAKKDDAEEATPTKKADKKTAKADKKVETDDVEEDSDVEDEGNVSDSEAATSGSESESEEETTITISKVGKPNLDAQVDPEDLSEDGDEKTAPTSAQQSPPFKVNWDATGLNNNRRIKWLELTPPKAPKPPKPVKQQLPSLITRDRVKQAGAVAVTGLAATVAGFSLPFILPIAVAGGVAATPGAAKRVWNSMRGLGPEGCKATRTRAREHDELESDFLVPSHGPETVRTKLELEATTTERK